MNSKVSLVLFLFITFSASTKCSIIVNRLDNTSFNVTTPKFLHGSLGKWTPFTLKYLISDDGFELVLNIEFYN